MDEDRVSLSWDDVVERVLRLIHVVKAQEQKYDVLLGIARGGGFPALMMAQKIEGTFLSAHVKKYKPKETATLTVPRIIAFPSADQLLGKNVLIVDEVYQSGDSVWVVRNEALLCGAKLVHSAVLDYKPSHNLHKPYEPTFYASVTNKWIEYPWEKIAEMADVPQL